MSNISQTGKHIFYTLNSLIASQNKEDRPFDLETIKTAFKDAIITDTFRKSLYAQEIEFGYVGIALDNNSANTYSEISAYSTYAYDYIPFVDTNGSNRLLKITFNNGLFSFDQVETVNYTDIKLDFNENTGVIQNNGEEIIVECSKTPSLKGLIFENLLNTAYAAPYEINISMDSSIILDLKINDLANYTNLTTGPSLLNFTDECDKKLKVETKDKYGVTITTFFTIKYRKVFKIYKSSAYSTKANRDWQTVKQILLGVANSVLTNSKLGEINKELNNIAINTTVGQYVLINTPEDKGENFTGVLDRGCVVEFIKIKANWYMSTGTNWNGKTLSLNL